MTGRLEFLGAVAVAVTLVGAAGSSGVPVSPSAVAAPPAGVPRCTDPSHTRLVVKAGRDVCGPTLLTSGPVSVGFLPSTCPDDAPQLVVDAVNEADRCERAGARTHWNGSYDMSQT